MPLIQKMIRNLVPLVCISIALSSCSLVGDAVDISSRRAKQLSPGEAVEGAGFTVRTPDSYLYPVKNFPLKGAVTFRPTDPMGDGSAYFVSPFSARVATTRQALQEWNAIPARKGLQPTILEQNDTTYRGYPATQALVEIDTPGRKQIASILVVKLHTGFLILCKGETFYHPQEKSKIISICKNDLEKLKAATIIASRSSS